MLSDSLPTPEESRTILAAEQAIRRNHVMSQLAYEEVRRQNRERALYSGGVQQSDDYGFPVAGYDSWKTRTPE